MEKIIKLWELPVPSNCIVNGVRLLYPSGSASLQFEFYDEKKNGKIFNGGIYFDVVLALRHSSEKYTTFIKGSYDFLIELLDSAWLKEMYEMNPNDSKFWNIRHFAIYFDSNGLYEFIAKDYKIFDVKEGSL